MEKKIDQQDLKVIDDAVRLSKQDFAALYAELGYNKLFAGVSWSQIRSSKAGKEAIELYKQKGANPESQPLTYISDVKEEVEVRLSGTKEEVITENKSKTLKQKKMKTEKEEASSEKKSKGKGKEIRDLIKAGERSVEVIMEKVGASTLYVRWCFKQEGIEPNRKERVKKVKVNEKVVEG